MHDNYEYRVALMKTTEAHKRNSWKSNKYMNINTNHTNI